MSNLNRTPKTLKEAIENGLALPATLVEMHVRDFLAQKFGAFMLDENQKVVATTALIWNEIFPNDNLFKMKPRGKRG